MFLFLLDTDHYLGVRQVDRFENLVKQVGESNHVIDYIKLDVELSEIDFLQDMIFNSPHVLHRVKQIAMEVHDGKFSGTVPMDTGMRDTVQVEDVQFLPASSSLARLIGDTGSRSQYWGWQW